MRARQLLALLSVPVVLFLERLTYYGCRALLVVFMTQPEAAGGLGMERSAAMELYGLFTVAILMGPALGGVAGLVLGPRLTLPVGTAIQVLGFGLLAAAGTVPGLHLALGTLAVGQALFRPNLYAVLGQELPDPDGNLRSGGMILAYGAINLGALLASMSVGMLEGEAGFGVTFVALTLVAAFTLLLVGGLSFFGSRAPPAPAPYSSTWVPGVLVVAALFTLPYLTLTLGGEVLHFAQVRTSGVDPALALLSINPWTVMVSAGLLFGLLLVLHTTRRPFSAMWLLGGGAVFAALAAVPLLLGGGGPSEPAVIVALVCGALAEVLVIPAALSRASTGPSPRVAALLLGVFFSWMGMLNHVVNILSNSAAAPYVLALLAFGSLVVAGGLLFLGRRLEQRLFAPAAAPTPPASEVSLTR